MNAFVKKSFAVAAMSSAMAAGVSVAAPALASADPVTESSATADWGFTDPCRRAVSSW